MSDPVGSIRYERLAKPVPTILLLVLVGSAYLVFRGMRAELPPGWVRTSFPSFLTPLAMGGVIDLLPAVTFRTRWLKWFVYAAMTAVAITWLEAVVPALTPQATGSLADALAMACGFVAYCAWDGVWGWFRSREVAGS